MTGILTNVGIEICELNLFKSWRGGSIKESKHDSQCPVLYLLFIRNQSEYEYRPTSVA